MRRIAHYLRGVHGPLERHPLGGWRCVCGFPAADLAEAGQLDTSHVPLLRRTFSRRHGGSITRSVDPHEEPVRGWRAS